MADLAKLVVKLEAESSQLRAELKSANKKLDGFGKSTKKALDNASKSWRNFKGTIATALAVGGLTKFVKSSLDAADKIQKLSLRLGASTEALSQYRHVAELTGVSFQTLTIGWQRMTRRIAEAATGTGEAKKALAELGLSAEQLNKLKPDQQFEVLADAIMNVESSADRVRLAMKLFDSEGVSLLQTMQGGSEAIRKMREEADRLGLTLSQSAADSAATANDAMWKFNATTVALGQTIAIALAPTIDAMATWLQENIPDAVQVTIEWFDKMREKFGDFNAWITNALADAEYDLAAIADFFGADTMAKAFRSAGDSYRQMSKTWEKSTDRMRKKQEEMNTARRDGLKLGVDFNNLYNAQIAEQARLDQEELKNKDALAKAKKAEVAADKAKTAALKEQADWQKKLNDVIDDVDPVAPLLRQLEALEELKQQFPAYADIIAEKALQIQDDIDEINNKVDDSVDKLEETKTMADQIGEAFNTAFENAIVDAQSFGDVLKALEQDLLRIFLKKKVSTPLYTAFEKAIDGFDITSFFGGARAAGGPVESGKAYLVGEAGPEIFAPQGAGTIIPNVAGQFGSNITVVQNIRTPDANSFKRTSRQIAQDARRDYGRMF